MNPYDFDAYIAEYYDQSEAYSDDVDFIRRLLADRQGLHIMEPFCGTGRILLPLAGDGHMVTGLDQAGFMLERARHKLEQLPPETRRRVCLKQADVTREIWPEGFDLVVLGGNCFYELATPEEQESCLISTRQVLHPGGFVYVDNDHMEGNLDPAWQQPGIQRSFPSGTLTDGTVIESTIQTIWFDAPHRLVRFCRTTCVVLPDGEILERQYEQQKHPVSALEVQTWLEKHGFVIEGLFGDREGSEFTLASPRAIFWARKRSS